MTDVDTDTLARTACGEARSDGDIGMSAVAAVVMNRCRAANAYLAKHPTAAHHPLYGDGTPASCCKMPFQFSCWLPSDPNRAKLLAVDDTDPQFAIALALAGQAVAGTLADPTDGATSYKVTSLPWPSAWGQQIEPCAVIGHQSFYRL